MLHRWAFVALLGSLLGAFLPQSVWGDSPLDTSFQGSLSDTSGQPLAGPVNLQIRVYDSLAPVGGEFALFIEDHDGLALDNGVFSLLLGQGTPVVGFYNANLFASADRYIQVHVNGERLVPRLPISSAPYAFQATNSHTLEGMSLEDITAELSQSRLRVRDALGNDVGLLAGAIQNPPSEDIERVLPIFNDKVDVFYYLSRLTGEPFFADVRSIESSEADCTGRYYLTVKSANVLLQNGERYFVPRRAFLPSFNSAARLSQQGDCSATSVVVGSVQEVEEVTGDPSIAFPYTPPFFIEPVARAPE